MKFKHLWTLTIIAGLCCPSAAAAAGKEDGPLADTAVVTAQSLTVVFPTTAANGPKLKRPAALPALYATLGAMQAFDIYSTSAALKAGAREANPAVASFGSTRGSMLGLKAASTVGTIFCAERLWKKNRVAAVVLMTAINGATAAVAVRNMRNARLAR